MIGRRKRLKRRPMPTVTSHHGRVQLEGTAKQALEIGRNRLVVAGAIFALVFAALGARLVDLAILTDGNEPRLAQMTEIEEFKTERAEILDRNGVLLATSLATASLFADPKLVLDPVEAARRLAAVLPGLGEAELLAKLSVDRRFVWLRRNLTPRQKYEVNRLGLPGLYFQREERRVYPMS
jgi:cell division protein FtsI (penicillin-binding protein 3)